MRCAAMDFLLTDLQLFNPPLWRCLHQLHITIMAEAAASNVPTFKLVLVGDGGTGKVSR